VLAEMMISLFGTITAVAISYAHNMAPMGHTVPKWLLAVVFLKAPENKTYQVMIVSV
jgi:hypothetical protein